MSAPGITLRLPEWTDAFVAGTPAPDLDAEARMRFVLALARRNVEEGSGGPFAAAVFVDGVRAPLGVGVNRVVPEGCSVAHAEVLALCLAEQAVGDFDLGAPGRPSATLVASSEMCAMCLGAVCWSGVRAVTYSCRGADVEDIVGFDEGPKPPDLAEALSARGIEVVGDVCRDEGIAVLRRYVELGGEVYNGRGGGQPPGANVSSISSTSSPSG